MPDAVEPVCGILVHVGVDARRQPKLLLPHVEDHAETAAELRNCFIVSLIGEKKLLSLFSQLGCLVLLVQKT